MKKATQFHSVRFSLNVIFTLVLAFSLVFPQGVQAQGLSFPAEINKEFSPISISSGGISRLSITIFNPNSFQLTNAAWADNLIGVQPGITIATPVNLTNTCGGTVVAPAGGTALSLSGGTVPPQVGITPGSCTVSIDVTSIIPGNLINTIPAGGLTGTGGGGTITNTTPASATLQVGAVLPPVIAKIFSPNTMWAGQTSQLTIGISNVNQNNALTQTVLTDNLPAGVVLANPVAPTLNGCGPSAALTGISGSGSLTLSNATIAPNGVCLITVNVTSTVTGAYTNTIPANAIQTQQGVTNASPASAPLNVQSIGLDKAFSPDAIPAGGTSTLTITLQNPTGAAYTGVSLSDTLPGTVLQIVAGSATSTCGGTVSITLPRTVSLTNGTVPAGTPASPGNCQITVQVTAPAGAAVARYTNSIPVGALSIASQPGVTNIFPANADLAIVVPGGPASGGKRFETNPIYEGDNTVLRIDLVAPTDTDLTNVSLTDNLPVGVTISNVFLPAQNGGCGPNLVINAVTGQSTISISNADIPAGWTCQIYISVKGNVAGNYTNTILASSFTNDQNRPLDNNLTANLTVLPRSDLSIGKLFTPDIVGPNGTSLLTISLSNTNANPLINASLVDNLPGDTINGVVIAPVPNATTTCGGGVVTALAGTQTISMAGGTIPAQVAGVPGLCTITVTVQGRGALGTWTNVIPVANVTGTIQGTNTVLNPLANATAPLTITGLSIGVVKGFNPLTVFGGSASVMSVQLINPNNADLVGIAFTDNMPSGMIVANPVSPSVGTCGGTITATSGNGFFSFSGGNLPPFGTCTLTLNITMTVNGNLTNTIPAGAVTTTNGASNPQPAQASLTNLPGASISKTFSPNPINAGDFSLLTITIQNSGNIPLTGMGLNDNLPGNLPVGLSVAGAPAPAPVNNCGGTLTAVVGTQTVLLTNGTLAASSSCTIVVAVTSSTPGAYQNIIPAGNLTSNEGATNNGPATDTLVVLGGPTTASIGDYVWLDSNANGIQDAGESGIGGVTVNLYSSNGTLVGTTTTNASGLYQFTGLTPGDYYVDFILPAGYAVSPQDQGGNDTADSDANPATGQTIVTTLVAGENDLTWDAGLYQPASLGDTVWSDLNRNGVQDGGAEVGIDGVTVNLYRPGYGPDGIPGNADDNNIVATTTTAGGGKYLFGNLIPGDYFVDFIPPAGYVVSPQDQGGNDATDSDANPASGQTIVTTLVSGENDLTWDAGLYQSASLGDFVWLDLDADGVQDATEVGVNGVTVNLYSSAGVLIATTTTSGGGFYLFTDLVPGDYYVDFIPPAGYAVSPQDRGGNDATDSDANPVTGQTIVTTITPGENDLTWDAGLYQPASLGDFVWSDVNANGIQDAGETGINGVTVNLYRPGYGPDGIPGNADDNNIVATTTTAGNGQYLFNNLIPGDYFVDFIPPVGYVVSPQDQGGNDTADSDANPATGQTIVTTLVSGENDLTWDAGLYQPASLGDTVWSDLNANGVQDGGAEVGIDGVTVNLYRPGYGPDGIPGNADDNNIVATTTTAGGGKYIFDNLIPGDYFVDFIPPAGYVLSPQDQGGNDAVDSDANPLTGQTIVTTLTPGENDLTWDAGLYQSASLGDYVWFDVDADGVQDATEVGVDGVTVNLYSSAGVLIGTTTTSAGGFYLFTNLTPGDYYVDFIPPAGYAVSPQDRGGNDAADSDANPANGQTIVTNIVAGENDLTWDMGLYQPASLGDFVWSDVNANGIQDAGETGINGVTVNLYRPGYGPDGIPGNADDNNIVATTTTAGNGQYLFNNLIPGDYYVDFIPPAGYAVSPQDQGGNDAVDSDANPVTGQTIVTALVSGENDLTWDAGVYQPASLGDFVWNDTNANGIQDAGETGINNVTVELYNSAGVLQATTTTNASGAYLFTGLTPGDYYVRFIAPNGYTISPQDQGGNDAADSDANPATGQTIVTTLTPGENDLTWDAGMFQQQTPGLTKSITGTNLASTTGTNTAIGEIVTYQVVITVPPGTYNNATLVDTMERGLAFVACDSIDAPGLTTSVAGSFTSVCANAVTSDAGGGTPADVDRRAAYDFGTLTNAGATDATITIVYRAIVLDIATNVTGNVLNNSVTWSWTGGSIGPAQTTVTVVEPALVIGKTANVNFVSNGSEVIFTLTISHTQASNSDAYDAVVIDVLPTGLSYVANSLDCTVGAQDPDIGCTFDNTNPAQPTIRAEWSVFTRNGGTGQIRFRVTGNASLPPNGVTNTANVEWTSMLGNQTTPQSRTPNIFSTERYYDPNDAINIYGSSSALALTGLGAPGGGGGGGGRNNNNRANNQNGFLIPLTGFAPNTVTALDPAVRPAYGSTSLTLEIPSIKVNVPIVGVELKAGNWDVSWLADQAGWLEGTAYPTWEGNSVLTAHVVNADGKPGLFSRLDKVRAGDYIFLYQSGYRYTYQIVSNKYVQANDINVLKHEDKAMITLITCDTFDEKTGTYLRRTVVRAVLVDVSAVE